MKKERIKRVRLHNSCSVQETVIRRLRQTISVSQDGEWQYFGGAWFLQNGA